MRTGALIGYARVSATGQLLDRQQRACGVALVLAEIGRIWLAWVPALKQLPGARSGIGGSSPAGASGLAYEVGHLPDSVTR